MTFDTIKYERRGTIGLITLNRPDKLNAINMKMVEEINQALDLAEADAKVLAIVLNGEGKAFSAGFDLETTDETLSTREELTRSFNIIMRFWESPKPTVAAVHKYCLGSAMEMAVACDLTIAAEGCRFGAPEVKFGSGIVALILPWMIGPKASKELLLTGDDHVSAERALALGLVNEVVAQGSVLNRALQMAETIAANDIIAVRYTKQAINTSFEIMGMRDALLQGLDLDIKVEDSETPESKAFNRVLREQGPKAAIAWRKRVLMRITNG